MAKKRASALSQSEQDALRHLANSILRRAQEIRVPEAKESALELAWMVLAEDPKFGERDLRDEEILADLAAKKIGLPTFRKALTEVRKELVKKPERPKSLEKAKGVPVSASGSKEAAGQAFPKPQQEIPASNQSASGSIAKNLDRKLI